MIELNKRDIAAIAINRHTHRHKWRMVGWIVALAVALVVTGEVTPIEIPFGLQLMRFIPALAIYTLGAIWWVKTQNKAVRGLLKQCEDDPQLNFEP